MTPFLLLLMALGAPPSQTSAPFSFVDPFFPAPSKAEVPALFRENSFTCATLAEAVNHYVDLGEEAAIKELETLTSDVLSRDHQLSATGLFYRHERICWVCRILFEPKGTNASPLRPARLGFPAFFMHYAGLPHDSPSPLTRWPLFPVAAGGTSYFVLSPIGFLIGQAEPASQYLTYCRAEGKFRTQRVPVPTRAKALDDLKRLRQSAAWKAETWGESGEGGAWRFIKAQAEDMPGTR